MASVLAFGGIVAMYYMVKMPNVLAYRLVSLTQAAQTRRKLKKL